MSRESNFINVIDALENIASSYKQIHSFGFGEIANINTSGTINYASIWVEPLAALARNGEVGYKVKVFVMDIMQKDLSNLKDVLNDMIQIAFDIVDDIKIGGQKGTGGLYPFSIKEDYRIEYIVFMERFDEFVAGWSFDLEVWARSNSGACDIPKN